MKNKIIVLLSVVFFVSVLAYFSVATQSAKIAHPGDHDISGIKHTYVDEEEGEHIKLEGHDEHVESHAGHDHERGDEHADESAERDKHEKGELLLSSEQRESIGIQVEKAAPGKLHSELTLTGELMLNEDAIAHIIPRVSGVAVEVNHSTGDTVQKGDVLAVLESAELGESFAEYMVSRKTYERKKKLYEEKIASQNDYLEALNRFEQVTADLYIKLGREKYLQASEMYEKRYLPQQKDKVHPLPLSDSLSFVEKSTKYVITSPIDGTIIEKHITRGEKVGDDVDVFTVANLDTVWVNLKVPSRDITLIHPEMSVVVESPEGLKVEGIVSMISPIVDAETRTATARVVIENQHGDWMAGAFVTGSVRIADENVPLIIPRIAVQHLEEQDVVFLADDHGFKQVPVVTGRHDRTHIEILSGLKAGQPIVTQGAFELKAILLTSGMDSHAGHGH